MRGGGGECVQKFLRVIFSPLDDDSLRVNDKDPHTREASENGICIMGCKRGISMGSRMNKRERERECAYITGERQ